MKQNSIENPLVSIVIITFNSSKYILETLNSARIQTYNNLELIISDDCSADNTIEICRKWLSENSGRFLNTDIVVATENTGISANCNRGVKASKGEWIKYIAGDDILHSNCISSNIEFINAHPEANFIFSDGERVNKDGLFIRRFGPKPAIMNLPANGQLKYILKEMFVPPMCSFIRSDTLRTIGYFDEDIPFIEDHSLFLKALRNGHKFYHLQKVTVSYRKHRSSITSGMVNQELKNTQQTQLARSVINFYDSRYLEDLKRFKLHRKYYHVLLTKMRYKSLLEGKRFQSSLYSLLNYADPGYFLKMVIINVKRVTKRTLLYLIYNTYPGVRIFRNPNKLPGTLLPE